MEEAKPQILLWAAPECPFRVTVPAPVINEIRILAVEAFYSVPRGGVEVGGVFFGTREPEAVHIRAQRPIRCEYSTGPSFTLSVKDQLGLSGLLDQAQADPELTGMMPLGWYHSHTRSEIFLSPADLQLYNEFFHERWQVALVVRPANLQPTRAGLFFREPRGSLKSDAPTQEFVLEPPGFGLSALDPNDPAAQERPAASIAPPFRVHVQPSAVPATPVDPPSMTSLSAAVSMLCSEPDAPSSEPETGPETAPPLFAPPPAATFAPAAGNGSGAIESEAPDTGIPDATPEPFLQPQPEKTGEIGMQSFDLAESAARDRRNTGWIWVLAIFILLAGGGSAAFLMSGRVAKPVDLGLETYDLNGALLIRWDRSSAVIRGATRAELEIEDGGETFPVPLSPGQLAAGGYGYLRRTAEVSVRMKVDGPTPVEEYSNFNGVAQPALSPGTKNELARALEEKEHLKTELINESMQSSELRREITLLRRQLAEGRAKAAR